MAHRFFQVAFLAFLSSGCATLFAGEGRQVRINTVPQGARVLVNGFEKGQTPADVALYPQDEIHLELEGYSSHILKIGENATEINAPFLGELALSVLGGGLLGLSLATGPYNSSRREAMAVAGAVIILLEFNAMAVDVLSGDMHRVAFKKISIQLEKDKTRRTAGRHRGLKLGGILEGICNQEFICHEFYTAE